MSNKIQLQTNNAQLDDIIARVNAAKDTAASLPEAGGGAPVIEKDVNFYDYDGTLLYSYTVEEVQALTELPTPKSPDPDYLVFQEWNWSLEELKELNDVMDVGANYQTVDGKTKLFLTIDDEKLLTVALRFRWNQTIDWGDGTVTNAGENETSTHTYSALGKYVISCSGWDSAIACTLGESLGALALRKAYIGNNISTCSFNGCSNLESISMPNSGKITAYSYSDAFYHTFLSFIAFPKPAEAFAYYSFRDISYKAISFPPTVDRFENQSFYSGNPVTTRLIMPPNLTKIGTYVFYGYARLRKITIPSSVTAIGGQAFRYCSSLYEIHMKPTTPPTLGDTTAFANGYANRVIYVPKGCLEAYQTATNWSTYASQMREEE